MIENAMIGLTWVIVFAGVSAVTSLGASGKLGRCWALVLGALIFCTLPFGTTIILAHSEGMDVFSYWARFGSDVVIEVICTALAGGFLASWTFMGWEKVYVQGKKKTDR